MLLRSNKDRTPRPAHLDKLALPSSESAAMSPYSWSCLACEDSNPPSADVCVRCGCPARATGAQVAASRTAWRRQSGLPAERSPDVLALINEWPLLLVAAGVLLVLGGLALIVGNNVSMTAFGGLLIALAALCLSSHRPPARGPDSAPA
jgi:hypothetical protein